MEILFENISFAYSKNSRQVLANISIQLSSGKLYCLKGANGSGKTTFGKLVLGLIKPNKGNIFIDGKNVKKVNAGKRAQSIGYMFQNPDLQLFAPTVWDELCFPFALNNTLTEDKINELNDILSQFNLTAYKQRFPLTMSGGEKQRLALATIVSRNVEFIILDEPTSAIDNNGKDFLIKFLSDFVQKGGGALIISHDENFLNELNIYKSFLLKDGEITTL